jgi:hypothetical protein
MDNEDKDSKDLWVDFYNDRWPMPSEQGISDVYTEITDNQHLQIAKEVNDLYKVFNESLDTINATDSDNKYTIKVTDDEMNLLYDALGAMRRKIDSEKYIRRNISNPKKYEVMAEIMGFKEIGKRITRRGYKNHELYYYQYALYEIKLSPNQAAEYVQSIFNFPSQEACNSWIFKAITKYRKEGNTCFGDLKRPQKSPI